MLLMKVEEETGARKNKEEKNGFDIFVMGNDW